MDILNFLNSKSVAEHLKKINYKFSPQEAAFIVWNSQNKTLDEKFAAWKEIIDTMPDCAVKCRFDYPQYASLRKFLTDYTALVSRVGENADEERLSEDDYHLYTAFEFMWFDIPTPFKKYDIVYSKSKLWANDDKYVLIDIANWEKASDRRASGGDYTDMSAHGYRILEDGTIDYDFFCNYIDFEYCKENELVGKERALKALSNYLKGNIDLELFLNAYKIILDEERIKGERANLNVTEEGLRLAGLKK